MGQTYLILVCFNNNSSLRIISCSKLSSFSLSSSVSCCCDRANPSFETTQDCYLSKLIPYNATFIMERGFKMAKYIANNIEHKS